MVKHTSQYVRACPCYESTFLYQTKYGSLANIIRKPALIILFSTDGQLLQNEQTNQVGEKVNSQQDKSQMLYLNESISSTALRRTFKTVRRMLSDLSYVLVNQVLNQGASANFQRGLKMTYNYTNKG